MAKAKSRKQTNKKPSTSRAQINQSKVQNKNEKNCFTRKITEIDVPKINKTPQKRRRNAKNSNSKNIPSSPPIFKNELTSTYIALDFLPKSEPHAAISLPNETQRNSDGMSPGLFTDSDGMSQDGEPSEQMERLVIAKFSDSKSPIETGSQCGSINQMGMVSDVVPSQMISPLNQNQKPDPETKASVELKDATTNTEIKKVDASTNTEIYIRHVCHSCNKIILSPNISEYDGSSSSSASETDLEEFDSDISYIEDDISREKTSDPLSVVDMSPPRNLIFVNQYPHSPEVVNAPDNVANGPIKITEYEKIVI